MPFDSHDDFGMMLNRRLCPNSADRSHSTFQPLSLIEDPQPVNMSYKLT